jgi:signal peptidase II
VTATGGQTQTIRLFGRAVPLWALGAGVAVVILIADQLSKIAVLNFFGVPLFTPPPGFWPGPSAEMLPPVFNLTLVWNRGVSFGLFAAESLWQKYLLVALALVVVAFLVWWLTRAAGVVLTLAIGLLIGGAVGNVIDRLTYHAVVDFLDFSGLGFPWVFNVADAAISVAVAFLVLDLIWISPRKTG